MMTKIKRQNLVRTIVQWIFQSMFFSLPGTYRLRLWAYGKCFGIKHKFFMTENVYFRRTHHTEGEISVGKGVTFSRGVYIDYTGGVTIGDGVALSSGCKLLSHAHDTYDMESKIINLTPLHIADGAWLCINALIMPGVEYIGKKSIISPGSVVYKKVPDYAIVRGNPAKVVAIVPPEVRARMKSDA